MKRVKASKKRIKRAIRPVRPARSARAELDDLRRQLLGEREHAEAQTRQLAAERAAAQPLRDDVERLVRALAEQRAAAVRQAVELVAERTTTENLRRELAAAAELYHRCEGQLRLDEELINDLSALVRRAEVERDRRRAPDPAAEAA